MKLVASLIVRNELGRYLKPCIYSLHEFCDEIRVLDDGSTDGSGDWLRDTEFDGRVHVLTNEGPSFFTHEGKARQTLLNWTLAADPTHVLAIDADEFVEDGHALRKQLDREIVAHALCMQEVWEAGSTLKIRMDGGWRPHPVPICWAVPLAKGTLRIQDRALACGREPVAVRRMRQRPTGICVLHFGWANPEERQARYERYVEADGGKFHASRHLQSIMWPESRIELCEQPWPNQKLAYVVLGALDVKAETITFSG